MRFRLDARLLLLILLAVLAAAAAWWWSRDEEAAGRPPLDAAAEQPDYAMAGFLLTAMDADGRPGHTLTADTLYHYAEREASVLTRPQLVFYEEDRAIWDVSAEHGLASDTERSVFLSGDVQVRYTGATPARSFDLYTGELHVWPDDRRARTEDAVRIVQESGVTHSVGMSAELDLRRLYLASQVRGRYEP